jgi:tetratricopeptide (TPR) repeat protein
MLPTRFAILTALAVGLVLVGRGPAIAQEQDNKLQEQLKALNNITGNLTIVGEYKTLLGTKDETKKLVQYAQEALNKDEQALSYNAAFILAEAARDVGEAKASEQFFRHCAAEAAKLESTTKLLQTYGGLIDLLYENKRYDDAVKVCKELLELKTGGDRPRVVLLSVNSRAGDPGFIELENYDSASRLKPAVHKLLIRAISKQGKFDQALKLVERLIQEQDHWTERQLKAEILREAGRYEDAAKAYQDVLQRVVRDTDLDAREKEVYEDRIRYLLSTIYVDLNQIDKASEQLRSLVSRHPEEPGYYNDLGYILADHGKNLPEAEKMIRKAIDLDRERRKKNPELEDKDNGAYLDSLGWALYKQKRYKEAKEWLEKAVQDEDSQHIEIYDHLGDVLFALGEREAALRAWRRGLELAGESRREQQRREAVEEKIKKHSMSQ